VLFVTGKQPTSIAIGRRLEGSGVVPAEVQRLSQRHYYSNQTSTECRLTVFVPTTSDYGRRFQRRCRIARAHWGSTGHWTETAHLGCSPIPDLPRNRTLGGCRRLQWWEDDDGDVLNIRRSVWRTHLNYETKTHEDEDDPGVVPIIEPLRVVLEAIKPEIASGWMFPNTIGGALDLENLADWVIKPVLKANGLKWRGWHAYRRDLGTNLHELGVPDKVIQAILRHEDVSTTQRSYIKTVPRVVSDAMRQLEEKIARAADVVNLPLSF
jgi:integrase